MAGLGQLFYKAGVEVDLSNLEKLEQRLAKLKTVYNIELRVSDVTALNYLERGILKTSEAATRLSKITKDVSDEIGDNFARASKKAADAANDIGVAIHQSSKHSDIKSATKELEQLTNGFSKYYTIVADIQAALSKGSNGNEFARNFKRSLGDIEATIRRYEALANAISTVHGVARDQGAIKGRQGNVLLKEAEQARTLANALAEIRDSFTKLGPNATGDEMFKSVSSTIKRVFGKDFEDALGSSFKEMQKVESKANVLFYNLGNNLKNATIGPAVEAYRKELYRSFEGFNLAGLKINSIMIEKFVPAKNSIKELWDNINDYFRQNPIEVTVSGGKKAKKTNSDDAYATHVGRPTSDEENERQNKYARLKDAVNGMIGALNDSKTISDPTKQLEFFTDAITKGNFLGIARANIDSFFKNEKEAKDFYSKFDDPKTSVFDKIQMLIDSLKKINPTHKAPSLGESAQKTNNTESAAAIAKAVQDAYASAVKSNAGTAGRIDSYTKSASNVENDVNNTFVRKTKEYTDTIDSALSSIQKIISSTKNGSVSSEFNLLKRDLENAKKSLESTANKVLTLDATPADAGKIAATIEGLLMRFQNMASATKNEDYSKVAKSYETLLALREKQSSSGGKVVDDKMQKDISTQLRLQEEFNKTGTITDSLSSSVRVLGDALNQVSGQVSNAVQGVRQISTSPSAAAPDSSRVLNSAISQEELEKRFNVVSAAVTTFSNDFSKMYAGGNKPSDDELKRFLTSVKSGAFGEGYKSEADKLLSMFSGVNNPLTGGMIRGNIEKGSKALYDEILNSLVKQFESYKNMMNSGGGKNNGGGRGNGGGSGEGGKNKKSSDAYEALIKKTEMRLMELTQKVLTAIAKNEVTTERSSALKSLQRYLETLKANRDSSKEVKGRILSHSDMRMDYANLRFKNASQMDTRFGIYRKEDLQSEEKRNEIASKYNSIIEQTKLKIAELESREKKISAGGGFTDGLKLNIKSYKKYLASLKRCAKDENKILQFVNGASAKNRSLSSETTTALNSDAARTIAEKERLRKIEELDRIKDKNDRIIESLSKKQIDIASYGDKLNVMKSMGIDGPAMRKAEQELNALLSRISEAVSKRDTTSAKALLGGDIAKSMAEVRKNVELQKGAFKEESAQIDAICNAVKKLKKEYDSLDVAMYKLSKKGLDTSILSAKRDEISAKINEMRGSLTDSTLRASMAKTAKDTADALIVSSRKAIIDQSLINQPTRTSSTSSSGSNITKNAEKLQDIKQRVEGVIQVLEKRREIDISNKKEVQELEKVISLWKKYRDAIVAAEGDARKTDTIVRTDKGVSRSLNNQQTIALMSDRDSTYTIKSNKEAEQTIKRYRDALKNKMRELDNVFVGKGKNQVRVDNTDAKRKLQALIDELDRIDSYTKKEKKIKLTAAIRRGDFSNGIQEAKLIAAAAKRSAQDKITLGTGGKTGETANSINDINNRMNETSRITQELGGLISQAFSIYTVQNFLHELVQVGGEMQKQHLALKSILGDVNRADTLFSDLKNQAINSPFRFSQLSSYAKQLSAYSIPYEELAETTKRLSDVSAGLGVDMSRIILAYGQIRSAAFLRGQELRQLTEAGIPMLDKLAEKFTMLEGRAVSTAEVFKKISSREVSFDMVKDVFWDLTNEGGQFYKMQENLMESVSGKMAKLRDQYEIALGGIADSNNKLIGGIIEILISLASNTESFVKIVASAATAWAVYQTTVFVAGAGYAVKMAFSYSALSEAIRATSTTATKSASVMQIAGLKIFRTIKTIKTAISSLGVAGWVGIAIAAISSIITYLALAESESEKLNKKLEEIKNETSEMSRTAKKGIEEVVASLKQATEGSSEWADIIKTINSRYGQYLDNILTEADGYDKVAEAAERAKDAITAKFAEERYQRSMSAIDETYKTAKDEAYENISVLGTHLKLESQAGDDVSIAESVKKAIAKDVLDYAMELVDYNDFAGANGNEGLRELFNKNIPFDFLADKYNLKELSYDSFLLKATGVNSLASAYLTAREYIKRRQQALKELQEETEGYNPWAPAVKRITDEYSNKIDKSTNKDEELSLKAEMYQKIIDEMLKRGSTSNNKYVLEYKKKLEEIQSLRQGFVNVAREVLDGNKKFVVEFNGESKNETIGFPSLMPGKDDRTDFDAYLRRLAEVYKKNKETIEKLDKLKEDSSGKQDQFGNEVFGFASAKDLAKANLQKELLDELARRYGIKWEDYEKSSSKNKKGSNEKDTAAEKLQKELDLMKDIYSEYEKWTKGPNGLTKDQAIKKILDSEIIKFRADELGLKNSLGKIDFSNIDQYKAALSRLKDTAVRLVNESTKEEWKERRKDIYKNICKLLGLDIPYDELKREAEALALRTQRSIDEATKKWDFVKTLVSSGKNAEKALAESFGDEEALKNISNGVYSLRQWLKAELKEKLSGILSNSDVPENISKNINALISDSDKKGGLRKYFSMTDDELTSMFGETTPLVKTFINALKSATENEIKEAQSAYVNALKETQTFLAKRNAIISEYNKNIAAEGLSKEAIDALTLNKDMKLSKLDFEEWKKNPYNSFVTTSLENSSAQMLEDTRKSLKTLIDKGRKMYDNATWTEMQELYNKILTQQETRKLLPNVFKSIAKRRVKSAEYDKKYEEVRVARASLYYAEEQLAMAADKEEKKIWKNTVDELYDQVSNFERELDDLEKEVKDSMQAVEDSIKSCISNFEKLGSSFKKLGDSIGGTVGKEISLAGDTFSAMSSMMSSAKNFEKGGIDSVTSAMEVLATSISITKTLVDSVQEYNERLYKKDADEKDLINSKIDLVNRYAAALIKTRQEEKNWFGTTSFIGVSDSLERSAQAANAYYDKLYESQAMYKNKQGKSYWRQITAGIVVAAGAALAAWTGGASAMGSMAAASALMAAAGAGYAAGAYAESGVEKMIDRIKYANGEVAAMYNLVIETQAAKNKLFKSRDQKTKDLQSWIYDNADTFRKAGIRDLELFNEEGLINKELAQAILDTEKWASKLQGQTEENLRELIELRDAVDEFQNSLRESISNAYDPIVSNMTDAIWDWFDNGANALRSFRDLAADTFRGIATELMQTMLYDKIFSQFKDSIYGLYEEYFYAKSNPNIDFSEEKLTNDISQEVGKIYGQFEDSSEAMKEFLEYFEGQLNEEGLTMKKKSSSSALSSSISNIKEETADILVAYCNGMRADLSIVRYINEMVAYEQLPQISAIATAQLTQLNMQTEYLRIISENTASNLFIAEDLKADLHSIATGDAKLKIS